VAGDERRALPDQASLRYLKVEAKRRVAAGEFPALHQARLAIAREHGQQSWAALRDAVAARDGTGGEGHALGQVRWVLARFSGAGEPGWVAPASPPRSPATATAIWAGCPYRHAGWHRPQHRVRRRP